MLAPRKFICVRRKQFLRPPRKNNGQKSGQDKGTSSDRKRPGAKPGRAGAPKPAPGERKHQSDRTQSGRPKFSGPKFSGPKFSGQGADGPRSGENRPRRQDPKRAGIGKPLDEAARSPKSSPRTPRTAKPASASPERPPTPRAIAAPKTGKEPQRIAKLLARAGIASRREIERMIEEGRIALNGEVLTTPATLLTSLHGITVDGNMVHEPAPARLFRFHKPGGFLTTERDPKGRPTIYDRLPADLPRVMPIGRLDMTTEGLLLLTTDGEFKRQMELPSTGVERTYRARAFGEVSQAQLEDLIEGVEIDGIRYGRIDANLERRTGRNQWIEMTLTEGKNREVRRVLEYLGLQVNRLIRTRYGPFELGDMPSGAVDEIRQHDLILFRKGLK